MESFGDTLRKLQEAHDREVEGEWRPEELEGSNYLKPSWLNVVCFPPVWQVKFRELSNKKGWWVNRSCFLVYGRHQRGVEVGPRGSVGWVGMQVLHLALCLCTLCSAGEEDHVATSLLMTHFLLQLRKRTRYRLMLQPERDVWIKLRKGSDFMNLHHNPDRFNSEISSLSGQIIC